MMEEKLKLFLDSQSVRSVDIPKETVKAVSEVIATEEGGWKYTDHPDDIDKGTYAGVRFTSWRGWLLHHEYDGTPPDEADFADFAENYPDRVSIVFQIYNDFYANAAGVGEFEGIMNSLLLSMSINCGPRAAAMTLQRAINKHFDGNILEIDGDVGPRTRNAIAEIQDKEKFQFKFEHEWRLYYADIIRRNANEWRQWGLNCLDAAKNPGKYTRVSIDNLILSKPRAFNAAFGAGWLNRIEKAADRA